MRQKKPVLGKVFVGFLGGSLAGTVIMLGMFMYFFEGCVSGVAQVALDGLVHEDQAQQHDTFEMAKRWLYWSWALAGVIVVLTGWYLWPKRNKP
jgi:hypothetical protein